MTNRLSPEEEKFLKAADEYANAIKDHVPLSKFRGRFTQAHNDWKRAQWAAERDA